MTSNSLDFTVCDNARALRWTYDSIACAVVQRPAGRRAWLLQSDRHAIPSARRLSLVRHSRTAAIAGAGLRGVIIGAKRGSLTSCCRVYRRHNRVATMHFDNERLLNRVAWGKVRSEFMPGLGRERKRVELCALNFSMIMRKRLTLPRHRGAVLL